VNRLTGASRPVDWAPRAGLRGRGFAVPGQDGSRPGTPCRDTSGSDRCGASPVGCRNWEGSRDPALGLSRSFANLQAERGAGACCGWLQGTVDWPEEPRQGAVTVWQSVGACAVHADMPVFTAYQGPMTPASFPAGPRCPDNDRSSFFGCPLYKKKNCYMHYSVCHHASEDQAHPGLRTGKASAAPLPVNRSP
jgi:hypothetical protein